MLSHNLFARTNDEASHSTESLRQTINQQSSYVSQRASKHVYMFILGLLPDHIREIFKSNSPNEVSAKVQAGFEYELRNGRKVTVAPFNMGTSLHYFEPEEFFFSRLMLAANVIDRILSELSQEEYMDFIRSNHGHNQHFNTLLEYYHYLQHNDNNDKNLEIPTQRIPVMHLIIYLEGQHAEQKFDDTFEIIKSTNETNGLYNQFQQRLVARFQGFVPSPR